VPINSFWSGVPNLRYVYNPEVRDKYWGVTQIYIKNLIVFIDSWYAELVFICLGVRE
jgi:hypothetical protein